MPDMVATFLPEGTLPEPTQNPHPVHLLIDPYEGKTKDYFVSRHLSSAKSPPNLT